MYDVIENLYNLLRDKLFDSDEEEDQPGLNDFAVEPNDDVRNLVNSASQDRCKPVDSETADRLGEDLLKFINNHKTRLKNIDTSNVTNVKVRSASDTLRATLPRVARVCSLVEVVSDSHSLHLSLLAVPEPSSSGRASRSWSTPACLKDCCHKCPRAKTRHESTNGVKKLCWPSCGMPRPRRSPSRFNSLSSPRRAPR